MPYREAQAEHQHNRLQPRVPSPAISTEVGETTRGQAGPGWTVVLRGRPTRIPGGQPQGGSIHVYELICCDCGDDPDLDYRDVSLELQQIRGPYPFREGVAAYERHVRRDHAGQTLT